MKIVHLRFQETVQEGRLFEKDFPRKWFLSDSLEDEKENTMPTAFGAEGTLEWDKHVWKELRDSGTLPAEVFVFLL